MAFICLQDQYFKKTLSSAIIVVFVVVVVFTVHWSREGIVSPCCCFCVVLGRCCCFRLV